MEFDATVRPKQKKKETAAAIEWAYLYFVWAHPTHLDSNGMGFGFGCSLLEMEWGMRKSGGIGIGREGDDELSCQLE